MGKKVDTEEEESQEWVKQRENRQHRSLPRRGREVTEGRTVRGGGGESRLRKTRGGGDELKRYKFVPCLPLQ